MGGKASCRGKYSLAHARSYAHRPAWSPTGPHRGQEAVADIPPETVMSTKSGWKTLWLGVPYAPDPTARAYLDRAVVREDEDCRVEAAVLDDRESDRFFGVPLARRGVQPVWLRITNRGQN